MDEFESGLRRDDAGRALLVLFFLSGATSLVWQTVWARELHLVRHLPLVRPEGGGDSHAHDPVHSRR